MKATDRPNECSLSAAGIHHAPRSINMVGLVSHKFKLENLEAAIQTSAKSGESEKVLIVY